MQKLASERRGDTRFQLRQALELKIVFSSDHPELLGRKISGETLDVSATGLRIEIDKQLKIDSVLDVWVTLKDTNRKYFLTGNVRWVAEADRAEAYQTGVVLRERSDTVTDLASWQSVFKK